MDERAPWMALAFRSALTGPETMRIALGPGPDPYMFDPAVLEREAEQLAELDELGVRVLTIADPEYPARLLSDTAPVVLQVAGHVSLLEEEGVEVVAGYRGAAGLRLAEILDRGGRAVVVISKGLLKAKSLLRGLEEALQAGSVTVVSAEPPRAAWGPVRDRRRDTLAGRLSSRP